MKIHPIPPFTYIYPNRKTMSPEEECEMRNDFISLSCTVPSYALWRVSDIHNKTKEQRILWWKNIRTNNKKEEAIVGEVVKALQNTMPSFTH